MSNRYYRPLKQGERRRHIIYALVRNEFGVLARIATLIAGKGYNIEDLSVGQTHEEGISRMTLEVIGDDVVIDQVVKQLRKLIDTIKVVDLTDVPHVERELALIKVNAQSFEVRQEIMRLCEIFRAKVVDVSQSSYSIEITGSGDKIDAFARLLQPFGIIEMARTGKVALRREGTYEED
ncbi:MAG: acetolactate synthase small subunit [Aquificaceae bacterium]